MKSVVVREAGKLASVRKLLAVRLDLWNLNVGFTSFLCLPEVWLGRACS